MSRLGLIKCAVVAGWVLGAFLLVAPGSLSKADAPHDARGQKNSTSNPDDYVGSDTCASRHGVQSQSFSKTAHARQL